MNENAYTTRAYRSTPLEYITILTEGFNHYADQLMEIINAAPHEDLPLIIAMLQMISEALAADVKPEGYVPLLVHLLKKSGPTVLVRTPVPKAEEEDE